MPTTIYDLQKQPPFHPAGGLFVLGWGVALSVFFLKGIGPTIRDDIQYFPAAFRESPIITIIATIFKLVGYPLFAFMCALLVYVPIRNIFLKQFVSGRLLSMFPSFNKRGRPILTIRLDQHELVVRDRDTLQDAISSSAVAGDQLQFTMGAFNRVLRVDKL